MIRLNFGANNNVIMTLSENVTIASPVYLCELTNQQSLDKSYLLLSDSSNYKQRYNKVGIFVSSDPNCDTLAGEVCLTNSGFYDYKVYECTTPATFNEASDFIQNIQGTLETGLMWLIPSATTDDIYEPDNTDTIIYQNV
jgi:hypothetical protein